MRKKVIKKEILELYREDIDIDIFKYEVNRLKELGYKVIEEKDDNYVCLYAIEKNLNNFIKIDEKITKWIDGTKKAIIEESYDSIGEKTYDIKFNGIGITIYHFPTNDEIEMFTLGVIGKTREYDGRQGIYCPE